MAIKFIFCINSGRSGSNYLSHLFNESYNCNSFHEPKPVMNGDFIYKYLNGGNYDFNAALNIKFETIIKSKTKAKYFEANHTFIKGFGWFTNKFLTPEEVAIIILKRNPKEVALSFIKNNVSPYNVVGRNWIILPTCKNPIISPKKFVRHSFLVFHIHKFIYYCIYWAHKFFKIQIKKPSILRNTELKFLRWYVVELNARAIKFQTDFPEYKYIHLDYSELNSRKKILDIAKTLGLNINQNFIDFIGNRKNATGDRNNDLS
ncbi:hypothetical protein MATR_01550 [Marivirga tractuosa]|uniref:Sulfotransferase domain-containing protein n=2 Tax=Marivirga TaxID=869806 RepID=E4TVV6_MARTH|nr:hypothetical protein Ftrac_2224 [Marivirga tractuosa DSM 4126]BDD13330.1 hypothetical protein MATR_01550 [Marivirga tractuosa]